MDTALIKPTTPADRRASDAPVRLERGAEGVHVITFDHPAKPVNVLDEASLQALEECLDRLVADGDARGVILRSAKPGGFIAGADVDQIATIAGDPSQEAQAREMAARGQALFGRIESLAIPSVALLEGTCLGGGLELALACDWRLVAAGLEAGLGLPEVKLGLIPGWGGTQRLPRVVGVRKALDLILAGRAVNGEEALKIGLADATAPIEDAEEWAVRWLTEKIGAGARNPKPARARGRRWLERGRLRRWVLLRGAARALRKKVGGHYPAPVRALESVANSTRLPLAEGLAREAALFAACAVSPQARSLIHVFHLQQEGKRTARRAAGDAKAVEHAGVIGAGLMGSGIAVALASAGVRVRMRDLDHAAVARGLANARRALDEAVKRHKATRTEAGQHMHRISPTVELTGFGRSQVVIEAVAEKLHVKRAVFHELAACVADDCVLATNTSSLRVADIAEGIDRPERVLGLHFFNPAYKMPLVEIVRTDATSAAALGRAARLVIQMGKTPVIVRDVPGFLVNRVLMPSLVEAMHMLAEGTDPAQIDQALRAFGMPMGPFELTDQVGLPIARHVMRILADAYGERMAVPPLMERIGRAGIERLHAEPGRIDPRVLELAAQTRGGAAPRPTPRERIADRLVAMMIAEAARCLEENVVASPAQADLAMVFGTGFPPFRGGLLRHADSGPGLRAVVERLKEVCETAEGIPAPQLRYGVPRILETYLESGRGFYEA